MSKSAQRTQVLVIGILLLLVFVTSLWSKRRALAPVQPISKNGISYTAPNDNGRVAYIVATDMKTGRQLWQTTIFTTEVRPPLEEDVQWVFISRINFSGNSILVKDEKSRCWKLDLATKNVSRNYLQCIFLMVWTFAGLCTN